MEYAFDARPSQATDGYRTPIDGLYLCGAGTHPGGAVTGAPGRNAAHAVLADLSGIARDKQGQRPSRGLLDHLMASDLRSRVSYQIARNPLFRPLTRYLSKNQRAN